MRTEDTSPQKPATVYLKDYKPYPFQLPRVELEFDLHPESTLVRSTLHLVPAGEKIHDLVLNGEDLILVSIALNGETLDPQSYAQDEKGLTVKAAAIPRAAFTLCLETRIAPAKNTRLEGLYMSGGNYCTQCEAEGFRRITYYPDRPDVLSVFTVRVEADNAQFPVLLCNGNLMEDGALGARHFALWHDPFPKPCYLFALVAGNLSHIHDTFTTRSGRVIDLYIFVRPGDEDQCQHAMDSLKRAMKWDEDVYGLEYDLDLFNIVAVSDFNMGAMENKSLNIFNTALVLAHPRTATDADFMRVESVIAHEYFHNWSGNRVTCRDWFQLSLKEGLTVFRDQEFSADTHSVAVQRIEDVAHLRRFQFSEDSGPLAHPVQPGEYIEINNFYTTTIYEKGAEVIRMLRTLIGMQAYRRGTDLYFSRHDGQAATCEDFIRCMEESSGRDLTQFRLWYTQAGTPTLGFKGVYDAAARRYTAHFTQDIPDTPGQRGKKPMLIPVRFALLDRDKNPLAITLNGNSADEHILEVKNAQDSFAFDNVTQEPVPSVLRHFSAPVKLRADDTLDSLKFLMRGDTDGFNRWESGQRVYLQTLGALMRDEEADLSDITDLYGEIIQSLQRPGADRALGALVLTIPDFQAVAAEQDIVDPAIITRARKQLLSVLATRHRDALVSLMERCQDNNTPAFSSSASAARALRLACFRVACARKTTQDAALAAHLFTHATGMTELHAALSFFCSYEGPERRAPIEEFYTRFKDDPLVIDKWFSAQAAADRKDALSIVRDLRGHRDFNLKNPNRVRALIAAFATNNPAHFHDRGGKGYEFLVQAVTELNDINPQIAARLLGSMRDWRRYTPVLQGLMRENLERISRIPALSPDVYEIVSKTLA